MARARRGEHSAAAPHGLTGLAVSSPVVSVVGYTLGGGLSWFGRKYGWAADSVRAFDIVDADGRRARVTAESDPELFWALRGGGCPADRDRRGSAVPAISYRNPGEAESCCCSW